MNFHDYDKIFHAELLEGARFEGAYDFPVIERTNTVPEKLISFDKAISSHDYNHHVHFFINDRLFMRIWNNPFRYLPLLLKYKGALAVDFSLLWSFPKFTQIESIGKSRTIGSWLQRSGVDIVPTARWALPPSYNFAFDAIAPGGTVAVGTLGCMKDPIARKIFADGLPELISRVSPATLIVYGPLREDVFEPVLEANIPIKHFESDTTIKLREVRNGVE